jgi:hypothetical protein
MALKIEFTGWITDTKTFDWGTVLVVSHDQRAQNAAGEWETVGKDYLDVTVTPEHLAAIGEAKLVQVIGNLKKGKVYSKKDGSQDMDLKVSALEVTPIQRNPQVVASPKASGWDLPAVADEDIPF